MYLSSRGAELEVDDDEAAIWPKRDMYDSLERAGRLRARPAFRSSGQVVVEKLYGTELLSKGWTCESRILRFSSKRKA